MSWKEFQMRLLGYNEAKKVQMKWERNLFYGLAISVGNFKKTPKINQWMPLPFEDEEQIKPTLSADEISKLMEREMAIFEKNRKK